ncbi:MAG: altronate dehydratase [Acidaminobacter sp.]|uniref:UxaA family hydrolase n=1 Tax=Acidaminobacter sp. TaxID=1872102 RepID=UPI001382B5F9|nr:UxaA family hydrolase [Acidaminobacter sp.]MZQ99121.1 altronate dehydratase [Acidaminobacter sp.]
MTVQDSKRSFLGYRRANGSVGIRNKILVLPTVSCSAETARIIAGQVQGAVTFQNQQGCGQMGADAKRTIDILIGLGVNPNVYGVVVVGLGCETAQPKMIAAEIAKSGKPVEAVVIQEEGGTLNAIMKGIRYATDMSIQMSLEEKVACDLSELVVALECGGSDPTSGLASNPSMGYASDLIVAAGGTTILSETTEFIGAEHVLAARAIDPKVSEDIFHIVHRLEVSVEEWGGSLRGGNPSPGNIEGGITTIEEKSLGCIFKGGTSPTVEVVDYGVKPSRKGLVVMDTPGFDVDSVVGMVAGGAQICVFTTGRGTPVGNGLVPVIKLTGNSITYEKMKDNIDINAGVILEGLKSVDELGREVFEEVVKVANGKYTKAEVYGFSEFGVWRCGASV